MTSSISCIALLDNLVSNGSFPEFVVLGRSTGGLYLGNKEDPIGLLCFSTSERLYNYIDLMYPDYIAIPEEVTFDKAREIVKSKKDKGVICLIFLDDIFNPIIHYVQ